MLHARHFAGSRRLRPFLVVAFFFYVVSGCAGRRRVVDRRSTSGVDEAVQEGLPSENPGAEESSSEKRSNSSNAGSGPSHARSVPSNARPGLSRARSGAASEPGPMATARHAIRSPKIDTNGYVEEGRASWYGVPFHGRRAANGEIYDMNKLTAAHRTLPFETIVRVTNLINGLSADVRITDRGPFIENRIIDLSLAAADAIDMVRAGVEQVRLEVISGANPAKGYFTVQVGAFRNRERAERLRVRLLQNYSPVFIETNFTPLGAIYRVHVGKISGEDAAYQFADQLRISEGMAPLVVRLDENLAEEIFDER